MTIRTLTLDASETGYNAYAKPVQTSGGFSSTPSWQADSEDATEPLAGHYVFDVDDAATSWVVFRRVGASKANTDTRIGVIAARIETKADADTRQTALIAAIGDVDSGTNGAGQHRIIVTCQLANATKVRGVRCEIAGTDTFDNTNTNGVSTLNVDDGSYTVKVTPPFGFESVSDLTVTVNGGNQTRTVTLVPTTLESPSSPELCTVQLPVVDQFGTAAADVCVCLTFVAWDSSADPSAVVVNAGGCQTSDQNGTVQIELPRLAKYQASYKVPSGNGRFTPKIVEFTVPDDDSFIVTGD